MIGSLLHNLRGDWSATMGCSWAYAEKLPSHVGVEDVCFRASAAWIRQMRKGFSWPVLFDVSLGLCPLGFAACFCCERVDVSVGAMRVQLKPIVESCPASLG